MRIWGVGLIAVAIWFLSVWAQTPPPALGLAAPVTLFSAARAEMVLARLLGPERPRPSGSPEAAAFRARLLGELTRLGVKGASQASQLCYPVPRWRTACGSVTNILAPVLPGQGKPILLMAHTDSVPAGPGAADDASGVATILETIRALKAQHPSPGRPLMALFTDGEEKGLLGGAAFMRAPAARNIGGVINVEARGNQGPSFLFQTGPGAVPLIDLYARNAARPATSSLYGEIYKILPNDTDLTPALQAGLPGVNFAFIGNVRDYHHAGDIRAHIDPRSLQHHGDNVLAMTRAMLAWPGSFQGDEAIYLDILQRWLPRLPASWAIPFAVGALAMIAAAAFPLGRIRWLAGLVPPGLLLGCIAAGFLLHGLTVLLAKNAYSATAMRLALAFGAWSMALALARWATPLACWLWLASLGVIAAVFAPGISPYFVFPSLLAGVLLLASRHRGREPALLVAALGGLVIWIGFVASGEAILGIGFHPLFTVPAAFSLIALLPLLAGRRAFRAALLSLALASGCAVAAAFV